MLTLLIVLQSTVIVWWVYLQMVPSHTEIGNYLFNGMYGLLFLTGGLYGLWASTRLGGLRSTVGRTVLLISTALLSYSTGQFLWMSFNIFLRDEVPYPSAADFFFASAMPLFGLGFWLILKMYRTFITQRLLVELLIALVVSGGSIILLIGPPDISYNLSLTTRILNVYYPLGDALLMALSFIAFRTSGGKIDRSILAYAGGMLLLAAGDTLFTYRNNLEVYWNGDISDLLFACSGFLMSIGIVKTIRSFAK